MPGSSGRRRGVRWPPVTDAVSDPRWRYPDGIPREMYITGGSLDLGMSEKLFDHRKAFAEFYRAGSEGVAEVLGVGRADRKSVDYWRRREFLGVAGRRLMDIAGSVRRC